MGISVPVLAVTISLHLIAFVFVVGAERRRAHQEPDECNEKMYCKYGTDASTVYGLSAFVLLLIAQALINGVTKCLCFGRGMMAGRSSTTCAVFFSFSLGSARNAYHTKYQAIFHVEHLSCATLRKGVFSAGAALTSGPVLCVSK